jgi:putative heme-binding domain-containing protein
MNRPTSKPHRMNRLPLALLTLVTLIPLRSAVAAEAPVPEWIWFQKSTAAETRFLRKTFTLADTATKAELTATADDSLEVFLNGESVLKASDWHQGVTADVTAKVRKGTNALAIRSRNGDASAAGAVARLSLTTPMGPLTIVTDASWKGAVAEARNWTRAEFDDATWGKVSSLGKLGINPWGNPFATTAKAAPAEKRLATPAESLTTLPGFRVELLRSAEPGEGSWVAMTADPKGRLIVSPQGKEPMLRVTLDAAGRIAQLERIELPVSGAMGLLHAFDALYVNGNGPDGYHLYRLTDSDGDDKFDKVQLLRKWQGGTGEHGAHGIVRGPDDHLYVVCGNFVGVPEDISPASPHRNYADDLVLPRAEDGNGVGAGRKPPGGYVVRLDRDGQNAELFASGQRNTYDIDFNADGELFGFDSDMEWDWGQPWYRPIRAYHIVSGGDQGFREGSAKWPEYYQDSLPAAVNIGIGSPTGVRFGSGARFPARYQRAFYMMDWTYGRLLAVHLTPNGASYRGTFENFVTGKPLNVTDFAIGADGALYFATGGRGTQSGLYRVSYTGRESTKAATVTDRSGRSDRELRHKLEAFHGRQDPRAVGFAWPHLNSSDRWIRYAARLAIESQSVGEWQSRALAEKKPNAGLTALLALARLGGKEVQSDLLGALKKFPLKSLGEEQQLLKLRVLEVSFARQGLPDANWKALAIEKLDAMYPARGVALNRELCQLLVALEAPGVVSKTLALLARAETQEEQITYIFALRHVRTGWTPADRRAYFAWFNRPRETADGGATYPGGASYTIVKNTRHPAATVQWFADVGREYGDGSSFVKFMANIRRDAEATLTEAERAQLAPLLNTAAAAGAGSFPAAKVRSFTREWKTADLLPALDSAKTGRSFEKGRQAFVDSQCAACHKMGNEGGGVGPDLTAVASRFTRRDILEAIVEPSKVISEQFQNSTIVLKNGEDFTGRVVEDTAEKVVLYVNPFTQDRTEIRKSDIQSRTAARLSPMPEGLANVLTKDDLLDLLAFLESAGRSNHPAFTK